MNRIWTSMNILVLSDVESNYLWDCPRYTQSNQIDLVLSCGDLKPDYLSYIATFSRAPVLYVHGNHDDCYEKTPPLGCICVEDQIYSHQGVRILGLGGSIRYRDGIHQYTQSEMNRRVRRMMPRIWLHHGFDILLTHYPAWELGDGSDPAHQGFEAFRRLMERYEPRMMIHGHTHLNYGMDIRRYSQYKNTKIVNAYERCVVTY